MQAFNPCPQHHGNVDVNRSAGQGFTCENTQYFM